MGASLRHFAIDSCWRLMGWRWSLFFIITRSDCIQRAVHILIPEVMPTVTCKPNQALRHLGRHGLSALVERHIALRHAQRLG